MRPSSRALALAPLLVSIGVAACSLVLSVDGLGGEGTAPISGSDTAVDSRDPTVDSRDPPIDVTADDPIEETTRDTSIDDGLVDAGSDVAEDGAFDDATFVPCARCPLTALYRTTTIASPTPQVLPFLEIANAGTEDQPLADVTIRYWYTINGDRPQQHHCDFAKMGCSNAVFSFVKLAVPHATANYYLEISFLASAGTVGAGSNSGEIQNRINKDDFSSYQQTDDWSFDATKASLTAWDHVTIYRKGALVYGTEPP